MSSGSYDVEMEQGPAYATKREQAQDGITAFIQAFPPAAPLIGDIYAKIMDFPHAEEIGERLEEAVTAAIKAKLQQERAEAEQASGKPPSPENAAAGRRSRKPSSRPSNSRPCSLAEAQAKVRKPQAKAETAKQNARKAKADADKAESEAQTAKANWANPHGSSAHHRRP
jgi:hypothetical protein